MRLAEVRIRLLCLAVAAYTACYLERSTLASCRKRPTPPSIIPDH